MSQIVQEYLSLKEKYNDYVIFFQIGQFYELFLQDADLCSKILNLKITSRGKYKNDPVRICGFPVGSYVDYAGKLLKSGHKVLLYQETSSKISEKNDQEKTVKRKISKFITPATALDDELQTEVCNSIAIINTHNNEDSYNITTLETNSGKVSIKKLDLNKDIALIFQSNEIFVTEVSKKMIAIIYDYKFKFKKKNIISIIKKNYTDEAIKDKISVKIKNQSSIKLDSLEKNYVLDICNLFNCINDLDERKFFVINDISTDDDQSSNYLNISLQDCRELNVIHSYDSSYSLINHLNKCKSIMGKRKITQNINNIETNFKKINSRLDTVEIIGKNYDLQLIIDRLLSELPDIYRIINRATNNSLKLKDLFDLYSVINNQDCRIVKNKFNNISKNDNSFDGLEVKVNLLNLINKYVEFNEDYHIKSNATPEFYAIELSLKDIDNEIKIHKNQLCSEINSDIKIDLFKNVEYHFLVPNEIDDALLNPNKYILVGKNSSYTRYTTTKLRDLSMQYNICLANRDRIEDEMLEKIADDIYDHIHELTILADILAELDICYSFALLANQYGYVRPKFINKDGEIKIIDGYHPLLVQNKNAVANSLEINSEKSTSLLFGANMSGKSTYLKQNGLILIMAYLGSFVPCLECQIGIFNSIYCRIGSGDDIIGGNSTFMNEMLELAKIVTYSTNKSLVLIDELGRGTDAKEGLAISIATVDYLTNVNQCRIVLSTHYSELYDKYHSTDKIICLQTEVLATKNNVKYLYKIIPYQGHFFAHSLNVVKLCNLPEKLIKMIESNYNI